MGPLVIVHVEAHKGYASVFDRRKRLNVRLPGQRLGYALFLFVGWPNLGLANSCAVSKATIQNRIFVARSGVEEQLGQI
jgi:hypothetical protein